MNEQDYISLTDIARHKSDDPTAVIGNWMRNRNTIEYLGMWETLYNPGFKPLEFDGFRKEAGLNAFTLSPQKWINTTGAIGIVSRSGRYGGTFAHKDIAFKFASWISVEFELYLVKEFQRLKEQEQAQIGWNAKRELSKINYRIHTDAIKQNLIPQEITPAQASRIYANEADVLNMALFGMTALEWRDKHPDLKGNIRDYASINELIRPDRRARTFEVIASLCTNPIIPPALCEQPQETGGFLFPVCQKQDLRINESRRHRPRRGYRIGQMNRKRNKI